MNKKIRMLTLVCADSAPLYTLNIDNTGSVDGVSIGEAIKIDTERTSVVNIKSFFESLVIESFKNECNFNLQLDEKAQKTLEGIDTNLLSLIQDHIHSFNEVYLTCTNTDSEPESTGDTPDPITSSAP